MNNEREFIIDEETIDAICDVFEDVSPLTPAHVIGKFRNLLKVYPYVDRTAEIKALNSQCYQEQRKRTAMLKFLHKNHPKAYKAIDSWTDEDFERIYHDMNYISAKEG